MNFLTSSMHYNLQEFVQLLGLECDLDSDSDMCDKLWVHLEKDDDMPCSEDVKATAAYLEELGFYRALDFLHMTGN